MLTTPLLSWWHHIGIHWNWFLGWWNPSLSTIKKCDGNNLDGKSSVLKVRTSKARVSWAVFFCCLGPYTPVLPTPLSTQCLRGTVGAYAAHPFEGVPTQAQRPCKATPQCTFLPTPSHFRLLLEGWKRNFCLRDHSPIHIFATWGALRHPALPAAARAPRLQSVHRHLAATPRSRTSTQVPKRALNIWWINHWRLS